MAKQLLKKYPKYQKKVFDILITDDETWVHFYEAKRKVDNRIWTLKHAKRPSFAKLPLTAKKVLYSIFFRNSGPLIQNVVPKGKGLSGSFYKNVVLKKKKIANKDEKNMNKKLVFSMSICYMAMVKPTNPQL